MTRLAVSAAGFVSLVLAIGGFAQNRVAATPAIAPATTWTGGPFLAPNPIGCDIVPQTCDYFTFSLNAPTSDFALTVRVVTRGFADDLDLFLRDANGNTVAQSTNETGVEELAVLNPPGGTYTVVVQPFAVLPGNGAYDGAIGTGPLTAEDTQRSYSGAIFTPDFAGIPESRSVRPSGPRLQVSFRYVGRRAAEPTIGVNANNAAFFTAGTFDFPSAASPQRLARTVVMRSRDKGVTWQPVSPPLALSEPTLTEPPFSLDPMVHVDAVSGRVFSVDLYAGCSNAIFSDDEGGTWRRNPLACGQPVNDHHTIVTAPPPPGLATNGYPSMLYYCFNRVGDSSCGRSNDGGETFVPSGLPAYTGVDPGSAGAACGGLTGHLSAMLDGRILLPKGHCGLPWIAASDDGGQTWTRSNIARHTPMEDHEVSTAVDTAGNIYAVWADRTYRLPFLSVSRDRGRTWSTPVMMAPPGVHEVNFPTIAAGDAGRIAVLFPGAESRNWNDEARPWNIYVVVSTSALGADPVFAWTTANDPADPVHRGACGPGRCDAADGGSMFDFLDIQMSPADGAFWGTASDTCVGACVTDPTAQKLRPGEGVAIRQLKGPSLIRTRR